MADNTNAYVSFFIFICELSAKDGRSLSCGAYRFVFLFPSETIKAYVGKTSYLDYLVNVLLHCLEQPPPPVNDTNPYNVFRPREKVHRLHTRRVGCLLYAFVIFFLFKSNWRKKKTDKAVLLLQMQRRENNVQSFEKLRQVSKAAESLYVSLRDQC